MQLWSICNHCPPEGFFTFPINLDIKLNRSVFFKEEVGGEVLRLLALSDQNKDIQFIISNQGNYLNDKPAIKLVLNGFQRS